MFNKPVCPRCESKVKDHFEFCPYCGLDLANPERDSKNFGILGKNEMTGGAPLAGGFGSLGITDKFINSMLNSLMKSLEKQMKNIDPEIQDTPTGIRINFGVPQNAPKKRAPLNGLKRITKEQIDRMSGLPRVEAKTQIRRLGDKVVYDLDAPGIDSVEDVFVSKLETGYELKAIGNKKVYVNSLPVDLPLKSYSVSSKGLRLEFGTV